MAKNLRKNALDLVRHFARHVEVSRAMGFPEDQYSEKTRKKLLAAIEVADGFATRGQIDRAIEGGVREAPDTIRMIRRKAKR